jgi:hypothetical protein
VRQKREKINAKLKLKNKNTRAQVTDASFFGRNADNGRVIFGKQKKHIF